MLNTNWLTAMNSDPTGLAAASQSSSADRAQYAQYAIAQAATAMTAGNNDLAITSFKKAIALDPNNTTAHSYLGSLYLQQGNTDAAIKTYQQLVRIQSNPSTQDTSTSAPTLEAATISLGNAYLQAKQYTKSEEQFKKASSLAPRDPLPPYTLGQQYLTQGRLGEALTQLQKAQKLAPNDGNVYYALGSVYNAQEKYTDAAIALQTSLQLKPNFPSANYQLGVAYNGLGYTDGVQQQMTVLNGSDARLAAQLNAISRPQVVGINTNSSLNTFNAGLGPNTPLWALDPSYIAPDSSKTVSAVIQFSKAMNYESVVNPANWAISRGKNSQSGYYNNFMPISSNDAKIPPIPLSVTYNPITQEAIVKFRLTQNSTSSAKIDPMHIVFTFNGQDASGQSMDQNANSIDGSASSAFSSINTFV